MANLNYDRSKLGLSPETLKFLRLNDPSAEQENPQPYGPYAPPQNPEVPFSPFPVTPPDTAARMAAEEKARSIQNSNIVADQAKPSLNPLLGTGQTNTHTDTKNTINQHKSGESSTRSTYRSKGVQDQIDEQTKKLWGESSEGINSLQALLDKFGGEANSEQTIRDNKQRILAQFADALTGSNITAGLPKQLSRDERDKAILEYANKIQQDKRDLAKARMDMIVKSIEGKDTKNREDLFRQAILNSQVNKVQDPNLKGSGKPYDPSADLHKHQKSMEPLQGLLTNYNRMAILTDNFTNGEGIGLKARLLPNSFQSAKASDIQSTYSDLKNQLIYAMSGKQINESEYNRLKSSLGDSLPSGKREFAQAMQRFGATLKDIMKQKEAATKALHPEVIELYRRGGGLTSDEFNPPASTNLPAPKSDTNQAPTKDLKDMTDDELKAYIAAHGG